MPRLIVATACMIASLGGCAAQTSASCAPGFGAPLAIYTLFLGKAIPGREDLTDKEWRAFLDTTVTAYLPNGYTVLDANGGWMNPVTHKTFKEGTKVLVVALPEGARQSGRGQPHSHRLSDQIPAATRWHDSRARLRRFLTSERASSRFINDRASPWDHGRKGRR